MAWSIDYVVTPFKPSVIQQLCLNDAAAENLYSVRGEVDLVFVKDAEAFWNQMKGSIEVCINPTKLKPPTSIATRGFDDLLKTPPKAFLSYLKELARSEDLPVCFYCHETWGGVTEYENAWVFLEDSEYLYIVDAESEANPIYRNENGRWEKFDTKSILQPVLEHLGFVTPERAFLPHTRDFDWVSHKVKCSEIGESISDA